MNEFVELGLAISISALVNVLFGSIDAILSKEFDVKTFFKGILKGAIIAVGCVGIYFVGTLLPTVEIPIGDDLLSIQMALHTVLFMVALKYVIEAFDKLMVLLNVKSKKVDTN